MLFDTRRAAAGGRWRRRWQQGGGVGGQASCQSALGGVPQLTKGAVPKDTQHPVARHHYPAPAASTGAARAAASRPLAAAGGHAGAGGAKGIHSPERSDNEVPQLAREGSR